jgi:hypothetical protein
MNETVATLRLVGANLISSIIVLKSTLPHLPQIKVKTKNNSIILGKWHKRMR